MDGAITVSDAFTDAVSRSRQSAIDLGDPAVGVGHLALGVIRAQGGSGRAALERIVEHLYELEAVVLDASRTEAAEMAEGETDLTSGAVAALHSAEVEVERLGAHRLDTAHLLLGILRDRHSPVADALARFGATYESVERELATMATPTA